MSTDVRTARRLGVREIAALMLVVAMAALVFIGLFGGPLQIALSVALQLAVGGFGAIALIGPARGERGIARYLTLPLASVAITVFGRLMVQGSPLWMLLVAFLATVGLWMILQIEMAYARGERPKTALEISLAAVIFLASGGLPGAVGQDPMPGVIVLIGVLALALGLRSAEARGATGGRALAQALLHGLAVVQAAVAVHLLHLPSPSGPAILLLAFYAWGGAADALLEGDSRMSVLLEFGALVLLGFFLVEIVIRS